MIEFKDLRYLPRFPEPSPDEPSFYMEPGVYPGWEEEYPPPIEDLATRTTVSIGVIAVVQETKE